VLQLNIQAEQMAVVVVPILRLDPVLAGQASPAMDYFPPTLDTRQLILFVMVEWVVTLIIV
jgi:hypothetical protein